MRAVEEARAFYTRRVPEQFNRSLEQVRCDAVADPAAARLAEEMEAVRTAIVVVVGREGKADRYVFEIERGEMSRVDASRRAPFLVLEHALDDFPHIRRACGESLLGFLGALSGQGTELRLTSQRVRSLREIGACVGLELAGPTGFSLRAHLGIEPSPASPRAVIRLEQPVFAALRAGELDPQQAFLDEAIAVEGDLEVAITLALAAASPD